MAAGFLLGLNLRVLGVIVILTGLFGLLLLPSARRPLTPDRLSRWFKPNGHHGIDIDEVKRATTADVAAIQEDDISIMDDIRARGAERPHSSAEPLGDTASPAGWKD